MAVLFLPRSWQCIVALVAFVVGFVSASSSPLDSNVMTFPLASFTMNLTSGTASPLDFGEIQSSLESVVAAQLNAFLQPSSGKIVVLGSTLVASNPDSIVVLFTGDAAFGLGIAPGSATSIEMAAMNGGDGTQQLIQRMRSVPVLRSVEDVGVSFLITPTVVNSSTSGNETSPVSRWFVPVITVVSIFLFIALLVLVCIILLRVRARRLRRQEKQDAGSKATRESDSETSEDEESTWYEDITREIKEFNVDAASWLDEWAKSIQSVQIREPSPQTKRRTSLTTPRPAARQSSRLTLDSIDEESAIMELPTRKADVAAKKTFAPPQVFNPHDMPLPEDPNVPALVMDHGPSRAYL